MDYFQYLNSEWDLALENYLDKGYKSKMNQFLDEKYGGGVVFPPKEQIFSAFDHFSPSQTKIVIIGQDPYHGAGQAHGLSFSVADGVRPPASLRNIFKSIHNDLGIDFDPKVGNLTSWAAQGVLMINSVLTVDEASAGSHRKKGWEHFTDAVIRMLSEKESSVVYLLWGREAWEKEQLIDCDRNLILKSVHPSPLSAYRGFMECNHFSKANNYLLEQGRGSVDFKL